MHRAIHGSLDRIRQRCFFHDDMGIGATGAIGTHACYALFVLLPRHPLNRHHKRRLTPGNTGVGLIKMQVSRNLFMLEAKHGLKQPGYTGRGFQMADVGLHGADDQGFLLRSALTKNLSQGTNLDGIAQGGRCAVGFNTPHPDGIYLCVGQRRSNQFLLG